MIEVEARRIEGLDEPFKIPLYRVQKLYISQVDM